MKALQKRIAVTVPREVHASEHGLFFALLKREGLPLPKPEVTFASPRRWRFDFGWDFLRFVTEERKEPWATTPNEYSVRTRVALEVEGGAFTRGRHTRGKGFIADMEKYNEAAVRGWIVLRVTPDQLHTLSTIALIKRALNLSPSESGKNE